MIGTYIVFDDRENKISYDAKVFVYSRFYLIAYRIVGCGYI